MPIWFEGDAPRPYQRIEEIHVLIGTAPNDGERILSADMAIDTTGTNRHLLLLSSNYRVAEGMTPRDRQIQREAMRPADRFLCIELYAFRHVSTCSRGAVSRLYEVAEDAGRSSP